MSARPQSPGHPDNQDAPPSFRPLADWQGQPAPKPVIWHQPGENRNPWPLVSMGEPGIISAPGGSGKSYLSLAIARAAVTGEHGGSPGDALGLKVRPSNVLLISYEDSPIRLCHRMGDDVPDGIEILPEPGPLVEIGLEGGYRGGDAWATLKATCAGAAIPPLVIIDPIGAAIEGLDQSDAAAVRFFMQGLAELNAGVLLIAHDTKGARNAARAGDDPGAGVVAGSSAWQDRARAVAYLRSGPRGCEFRILEVTKANHGPAGWGIGLRPDKGPFGDFMGFLPGGFIQPEHMDQAIKELRTDCRLPADKPAQGQPGEYGS